MNSSCSQGSKTPSKEIMPFAPAHLIDNKPSGARKTERKSKCWQPELKWGAGWWIVWAANSFSVPGHCNQWNVVIFDTSLDLSDPKRKYLFFFTPLKSYDVIFSWQMSWFKFWDAWKYFLNSLSGSLQLQLHCYNKSCNAVLYGPYFPFNRHSGNILKRFCVRYVLSEPKPLHAKYADWDFCAKLEDNTMFDLCLECSVYWLRFCVAILWKNDLTINELEKLLHMWPSFNECTEISGLLWVLGNLWCLTIPLENDFTWGARNAWTQILQSPQWNPKKCSQS